MMKQELSKEKQNEGKEERRSTGICHNDRMFRHHSKRKVIGQDSLKQPQGDGVLMYAHDEEKNRYGIHCKH